MTKQRTYIAHGTLLNVVPGKEGNLGENGYLDMSSWFTLLFTWSYHNTLLISYTPIHNKKLKKKKGKLDHSYLNAVQHSYLNTHLQLAGPLETAPKLNIKNTEDLSSLLSVVTNKNYQLLRDIVGPATCSAWFWNCRFYLIPEEPL